MTQRERFISVMEYKPVDRVPNHEAGVWDQTKDRWASEGLDARDYAWDWFTGEDALGFDAREFININYGMLPRFEYELIEKTDRYEIFRDTIGITHKALIEGMSGGTRACMDQYLGFPVETKDDFQKIKKRYNAGGIGRYPVGWREINLRGWKNREHVLILGRNCSITGFYWRMREWMGTENLSYAWYDQPGLISEMVEFIADFIIAVSTPLLKETDVDYVMINEDMSMKTGPLMSPAHYRKFIYPQMVRLVDFFKANGVRYVIVDTDGNCDALIPHLMEAGVDGLWPLERVAGMDPIALRKKYGRSLRLWGGVDKMQIARGKEAIDSHLAELRPLIEEGGFIPTIDHTVPPDISLANFMYYLERKRALLSADFA